MSFDSSKPMCGAHLTDEEVANKVRMLMRGDLDHEAVCTMARDRIMALSQELQELKRGKREMMAPLPDPTERSLPLPSSDSSDDVFSIGSPSYPPDPPSNWICTTCSFEWAACMCPNACSPGEAIPPLSK